MKATETDSGIKEASAAADVKGQMEPTPRPWKTWAGHIYAPGDKGGNVCSVSDPRAQSVVGYREVRHDSADLREAYANAELICRAVNNFDALVNFVKAFHDMPQLSHDDMVRKHGFSACGMDEVARDLLAKVEAPPVPNGNDSSSASSSPKSAAVTPTKGTN